MILTTSANEPLSGRKRTALANDSVESQHKTLSVPSARPPEAVRGVSEQHEASCRNRRIRRLSNLSADFHSGVCMSNTTVASGLLAAACLGLSGGGGAEALGREAGTVSCCIVPGSLQALSESVIGGFGGRPGRLMRS